MGNKPTFDADSYASKYRLARDEIEAIAAAFHVGNTKGKPLTIGKFRAVLAEIYRVRSDPAFQPLMTDLCFYLFDSNHVNKITLDEFIRGIAVTIEGTVEEKTELVFRSINISGNGKLTKREFARFLYKVIDVAKFMYNEKVKRDGLSLGFRLGIKVALKVAESDITKELMASVFQADSNNDQVIDLEEWRAAIREENQAVLRFLNPTQLIQDILSELPERLDKNVIATTKEEEQAFRQEVVATVREAAGNESLASGREKEEPEQH